MAVIRVLFFGASRSVVGGEKERLFVWSDRSHVSIAELVAHIAVQYPPFKDLLHSMLLAVNMEYVDIHSSQLVTEKDEIAIIPPLSGG